MHLKNTKEHLRFFFSKDINLIYISVFFMTLAESMIEIFVPIYLYGLGYSIQWIIFFYLLSSIGFVAFSLYGAKIASDIGLKKSILISTPFLLAYYAGLKFISVKGEFSVYLFFIMPFLLSFRGIFYNYGFHLNYLKHSDDKKRGRELSFMGILSLFAALLSPLFSGLIIKFFGYGMLFLVGGLLLILGAFILFFSVDHYERQIMKIADVIKFIKDRNNRGNILSFTGYSIESIIGRIIWPVFLIILILTPVKVGIMLTLSLIISLLAYYFIGKYTDRYDKSFLLKIGTVLYFFGWLSRLFVNTPLKAVLVDSYKNTSEKLLQIPWSAKSYDIAKRQNTFIFIISREIIFNASRIIFLPILILMFYIDFHPFLISFTLASLFTLLYPLLGIK